MWFARSGKGFGRRPSARVVPPNGMSAWLTAGAAAAIAFLATFILAIGLAAGHVADRWSEELSRSVTIRLPVPAGEAETEMARILQVLRTTAGVARARAIPPDELEAYLEPWLGDQTLPEGIIDLPAMIEVIETPAGLDPVGLEKRLQAELPGTVVDDHARWRRPLVQMAARLRLIAALAVALTAAAGALMVAFSAMAALSANDEVIHVLRLIGAEDGYIARAFVGRQTLRALAGALIGNLLAIAALLWLPTEMPGETLIAGLALRPTDWLLLLLVPLFLTMIAWLATRLAVRRHLKEHV